MVDRNDGLKKNSERSGKTVGVAKATDVLLFQWSSDENPEDKWMQWAKLMKQVVTASLGDDARQMLTIVGLEKAKGRNLEQRLLLRPPHTLAV